MTAVGSTILLWNHSLLGLWVGPENYAGTPVNLLIVFIMAQTAFIRSDAFVIDAALQPRLRVAVTAATAALTIGLATLLTMRFGMVGLCAGVLAGRLTQSIAYPRLVRTCLGPPSAGARSWMLRPLLVMSLLFAAAAFLGDRVVATHWIVWAAGVGATLAVVLPVALATGLPPDLRAAVLTRFREARRRFP